MSLQTSLNLWNENYLSEFFFIGNTQDIFQRVLSLSFPVIFSGPSKCGKKHLAFKVSAIKNSSIFFLNSMSDSEIIDSYDSLLSLNQFAIFILSDFLNSSNDVKSRLSSLISIDFSELKQNEFLEFLLFRLKRVGVYLDDNLLKYSIARLPCSYIAVDSFISFLGSSKSISNKSLKLFFDLF